jgi:hypothetical protein
VLCAVITRCHRNERVIWRKVLAVKLLTTVIVLLLLSTTDVLSQNPPTVDVQDVKSPHFRWSERLAHELDHNHTIATAKGLSPSERRDLLAFVLHRFKHPVNEHDEDMFEGIADRQMGKLAGNTRIELFDLNGDGTGEIIAQGNGFGACGATGNCVVLLIQRTPEGLRLLLDSRAGKEGGGFEKIRVLESVTNGFQDIVLASHVSASERTLEVFRFSDGKYRRSDCYHSRVIEGLKDPEISRGCGD